MEDSRRIFVSEWLKRLKKRSVAMTRLTASGRDMKPRSTAIGYAVSELQATG